MQPVQRVEKPFSARWQTVKKVPEAEQLAPVGVQRYGRARVAMEVKILAEQAEVQQNHSLYVILRSVVTKNLFSFDTAKILRVKSGTGFWTKKDKGKMTVTQQVGACSPGCCGDADYYNNRYNNLSPYGMSAQSTSKFFRAPLSWISKMSQ